MKILLLAPQPFFQVRGTPLNIRNVLHSLSAAGHEIDMLTYPFGEDLTINGVKIHRIPGLPGIRQIKIGPSWPKLFLDIIMALWALKMCLFRRYQAIHAVEETVFIGVVLKYLFRLKLVYDMDSQISDQLRYSNFIRSGFLLRMIAKVESWVIRRCDAVITVCASLTDAVRATNTRAHLFQIEDAPLDHEFVPQLAAAEKLREELGVGKRPLVLYTGNFEHYQGIDLLIRSVGTVVKSIPECRFVLVGGEEKNLEKMRQLAKSSEADAHCVFTGRRPISEMRNFLTAAEVLVAPRTFGSNTALKIYGYMQSGKPIVATNLRTHTQVLDDRCSILVEPNPEEFAGGIIRALRDPAAANELGRNAQREVERYSLSEFHRKVQACYQRFNEVNFIPTPETQPNSDRLL